jgi:transcriptional regulator with XRE-family HTH domain
MDSSKKELGQRLKYCREKKNLKQNKIALTLGVHNSTLAKYESGKREPDTETLIKLSELYGVELDWLLTGHRGNGDEIVISPKENIFFKEYGKLSEDDKQKALEHIKFLRHLAEKENKQQ